MADDGSEQGAAWPTAKFHFKVEFGQNGEIPFQEISGLDIESQPIEFRAGNSKTFSVIKMPGIQKTGNITMKRGVFGKDNQLWKWFNEIKLNSVQRVPITITLSDESGNPTMVWTLANAWPTKITATDMNSDANEVAIETLEIAHEGITIANR
jgi:phage tail-like protein